MGNSIVNYLQKIVASIVIALVYKLLFFRLSDFLEPDLFIIPFIVLILWEGNTYIDRQLEKRYSWLEHPKQRILNQFVLSFIFSAISLFLLMNFIHFIKFGDIRLFNRAMRQMFVPSIIITFLGLIMYISFQFFKSWKNSLLEIEKYKAETATAHLQNLKNQLNPHFLFNNLSVLSSLVYKDQDQAVQFINELSKVYRYILENKNAELVSLQEELDFLNHYLYLLNIRFGKAIIFSISIDKNKGYLLPMSLQTLIENTFQHNETSLDKPLHVEIFTENNSLIIQNKIQLRSDIPESSQTGLNNIQRRYLFFTDRKIEIINDGYMYKVILPIIHSNESRYR